MNKKNIFLGLAVLFCASQVSAGWRDNLATGLDWVKSGISWVYSGVRFGITSIFSLSTRACVALKICAMHALRPPISKADATAAIKKEIRSLYARRPVYEFTDFFDNTLAPLATNMDALEASANQWSQDDLLAAYNYFGMQSVGMDAQADLVLKIWVARFLKRQLQTEGGQ